MKSYRLLAFVLTLVLLARLNKPSFTSGETRVPHDGTSVDSVTIVGTNPLGTTPRPHSPPCTSKVVGFRLKFGGRTVAIEISRVIGSGANICCRHDLDGGLMVYVCDACAPPSSEAIAISMLITQISTDFKYEPSCRKVMLDWC